VFDLLPFLPLIGWIAGRTGKDLRKDRKGTNRAREQQTRCWIDREKSSSLKKLKKLKKPSREDWSEEAKEPSSHFNG